MKEINVLENIGEIMQGVSKGVLFTTKNGDRTNTMAISWGTVGIEWGKPVFIAFIREGRFTRTLLEENLEFTVSIASDKAMAKIMGKAGSTSGRNGDKMASLGVTLVDGQAVSTPAIKEFPLTLECKVVSHVMQGEDSFTEYGKGVWPEFYPQDVPSDNCWANKDFHMIYVGEIVKAYYLD